MESTLIILKPDAVKRCMVYKLIGIWEKKGFTIARMMMMQPTKSLMSLHYQEHAKKPFFDALVSRMISGPCVVMVVTGPDVVQWSRIILGDADPESAGVTTIRGKYATSIEANLVHASDSVASAKREIALWFE